jgi:hypothetical protein
MGHQSLLVAMRAELITPEVAAQMLALNTNNRPRKRKYEMELAEAMMRGEWQFNGDTIRISESNVVLDGQHRLSAIVRSGIPQQFIVVRGLPDETFQTIDRGVKRTVADTLSWSGEKNANVLAAAARAILVIQARGASAGGKITPAQHRKVLHEYPSMRRWAEFCVNDKNLRLLFTAALAGIACLFAAKYGEETVERFLRQLSSGENLRKGDPAFELRNRAIANKASVAKIPHFAFMQLVIKALSAHVAGRKIGVLRVSQNEEFPTI